MTATSEHTAIFQLPSIIAGQLVCTEGTAKGQSWPLSAGTFVIGRLPELDLPLPDEVGVSKYHAKIVAEGLQYTIYDTESRNGTLVNGQPVQKAELRDGDEIRVCGCVLRFSLSSSSSEPDARAAVPSKATAPPTEKSGPPPSAIADAAPSVVPASTVSAELAKSQTSVTASAEKRIETSEDVGEVSVELEEQSVDEGVDFGSAEPNPPAPTPAKKVKGAARAEARVPPKTDTKPPKRSRAKVLLRAAMGGLMFALFFVTVPSFLLIGFGPKLVAAQNAADSSAEEDVEEEDVDGEADEADEDGEEDEASSGAEKAELAALSRNAEDDEDDEDSDTTEDEAAAEGKVASDPDEEAGKKALLARVNVDEKEDEPAADEDESDDNVSDDDEYDDRKDTSYRNQKPRKNKNTRTRKTSRRAENERESSEAEDDEDDGDEPEVRREAKPEPPRKEERRSAGRRFASLSTGWFPVRVVAGEPVVVRSAIGGRVRALNQSQGARVEEGAALAEMDMRATDAKIETLKVSIQALEGVAASQDDAKAYLREERTKLRKLMAARQKSSILSPTTGRLTEVFISAGDKIRARQVIAKVMPENTNEVFARVPTSIGQALEPGAPAEFRLSNGQIRAGRVRAIKQQQQSDYRVLLKGNSADLNRVKEVRFP